MLTYAFITTRDGIIISSQVVRKQRFMYVALGHWPSYVNPQRENLLQKNGVDSSFLIQDEYEKIVDFYSPAFSQLWKIRFKEHPYEYDSYGWGHGSYKPSQKQMEFLKEEYGIHNVLTDYIYGESLFKLLRDIRDQAWITYYMSLAKDPIVQGP